MLSRRHRRSAVRAAAHRAGRVEHDRRPHRGAGPGVGADPRRAPPRQRHPDPLRLRRCDQRVPGPHPRPARATACAASSPSASRSPNRSATRSLACVDWLPALDTDGSIRDGAADRRDHPPRRPVRLPRRHPDDRAPGTAAPRRPAEPVRHHRGPAPPGVRHRHPTRWLVAATARAASPRPRPGGGPHPQRQRLRLRPVPVPPVRHQPAWLELALVGIDLLAWTRTLLLDGEHALAEPKKLRYRLLHVAARLVRTARRTYLRIAERWPWASDLATAFNRLATLPRPLL